MNWKVVAAAAWTLLIVALCSLPGSSLPRTSFVGLDKVAHFTLFGVFAWLWLDVTRTRGKRAMAYVLASGLLLAGLTEIYQGLLPFERDPSLGDMVANSAGLVTAIAVYHFFGREKEIAG